MAPKKKPVISFEQLGSDMDVEPDEAPKRAKRDNPIAAFVPIKYVCSQWPYLSLGGGMKFDKGFLTVTDEEQQKRVERSESYKGRAIVKIQEKKGRTPSVEESAERAALDQLERMEPQARRGMVGSGSM